MTAFRSDRSVGNRLLQGAVAGATGTAVMHAVTYLDMLIRGRPASEMPARVAGSMADAAGIEAFSSDNDDEVAKNRRTAAGALLGYSAGLGMSMAYALVRSERAQSRPLRSGAILGLGAMGTANIPIMVTGHSDPRDWSRADWLSDLIPHLTYGFVSAAVLGRR